MSSADLAAVYAATTYMVETRDAPLFLRLGRTHADLDRLLAEHGVDSWAFLTAYNPGSVRLEATENQTRQRQLEEEVRHLGKQLLPGQGVADDYAWPPEESVLILGIDEATAVDLGRRFGQAALVYGTVGTAARLVWITSA